MTEAVAASGVDLNFCARWEHLSGALAFVPGLGPRKAKELVKPTRTVTPPANTVDSATSLKNFMAQRLTCWD